MREIPVELSLLLIKLTVHTVLKSASHQCLQVKDEEINLGKNGGLLKDAENNINLHVINVLNK